MLTITVPGCEVYDEVKNEFRTTKDQVLNLEHSLVSLSKWESKWHKAFIGDDTKTNEQMIDYVRCMTLTQNVNPIVYNSFTKENWEQIYKYIEDPMTATTIKSVPGETQRVLKREIITSELIYYYMVAYGIPWEAQKWHLNRLVMLIRVCSEKEKKQKKMSKKDVAANYASLNASRKAKLGTRG